MRPVPALALALALALAPALGAASSDVHVLAAGHWFAPPAVVVPVGTTVVWDGVLLPHTVTTADSLADARAGRANDPLNADGDPLTFNAWLPVGSSAAVAFSEARTVWYFCEIHFDDEMYAVVQAV